MRLQLQELEELKAQNETRKFYRKLNNSRKDFKPRLNMCRDKDGNILNDENETLERWAENFKERLNRSENLDNYETEVDMEDDRERDNIPTVEEIQKAVEKLRNNRAPGADEIPAELLKKGLGALENQICQLISLIWKQVKLPDDWYVGIIIPIHKKGDQLSCDNYRGITLLNMAYKILAYVIYNRLQPYAENIIGKYQSGFCREKSTIDQIFMLRQVLEKTHEYGIITHHLFIDFKSAYDSIDRIALYEAMKGFNIPAHLIRLIKETLSNVVCQVKIQKNMSRQFTTHCGLRQGDSLSCLLFNLALERAVRDSQINTRGTIINRSIQILAYADDIDLIARSKRDLVQAFTALKEASKKVGLEINLKKKQSICESQTRHNKM